MNVEVYPSSQPSPTGGEGVLSILLELGILGVILAIVSPSSQPSPAVGEGAYLEIAYL